AAGRAAMPGDDPDWPCRQRLVPSITAAAVWQGPALDAGEDWRREPRVAALIARITPRQVSAADGEAAIKAFLDDIDGAARVHLVRLAAAGLLDETNRQRAGVIARIKQFAQRQRSIADVVAQLTAELRAMPAGATDDAAAQRAELEQRRTFTSRAFQEAERTVRYACETPGALESRLGSYLRAL